jgi:hypothetical protein
MTTATQQYRTHAENMRAITGLQGAEVGTVPDVAHMDPPAGYHVGVEDIQAAGRYNLDYSTRQARDRRDGTNSCSAVDYGDNWPHGGRAAWLRWNNLFLRQLMIGDPELVGVRAINFSPDGVARRRYDTNNRTQGVINSTDTVTTHTHMEVWRDQSGPALDRVFRRIEAMARAAIANQPLEDDMGEWTEPITQNAGRAYLTDQQRDTVLAIAAGGAADALAGQAAISARVTQILAAVTELTAVLDVVAASILAGGGSVDTAAILAGVDERLEALARETRDAVADLGEGGATQVRADA